MTEDEFVRMSKLFQSELAASEVRLAEQNAETRRTVMHVSNKMNEISQRMTTLDARVHTIEEDHRLIKKLDRGSQAKGLEHDAAIGLLKGEVDEIKAVVVQMAGEPKRNSKAPATLAAIGEAQQQAARSRWLPIALGVATAIGTMVNVLLHK